MSDPEWYGEWRHDAVHQLQEKNAGLESAYRLGRWKRFDYDLEAGTLTFSEDGKAKVIVEVEAVGTTSGTAGNWLWSWANSGLPAERCAGAQLARRFGEENGISELVEELVEAEHDVNGLGWSLTAVVARLTDGLGAYRPPREDGGGLFLVYRSISWAS